MESKKFFECIRNIKKTVLKRGENGRKASDGSMCCVAFSNVIGEKNLKNSLHLKSTTSTITIGVGHEVVDRVIEYCIQTMAVSEESQFNVIPLNLKFNATLENCFFKPYTFQMSDIEKLSMARTLKEQGVELYKSNEILYAFRKFGRALQYILIMNTHYATKNEADLDTLIDESYLNEIGELQVNVYNNLALCQLQYKSYDSVIPLCTKSLMIKANVKAFYRRAMAFMAKIQYDDAQQDLVELLKLDPNNKVALEKLSRVRELDQKNREEYEETVKKMFSSK